MKLLDLFCGAGGAAMGYHRAGFDVVGVDINPQPHYPFEFHQSDALTYPLVGFDAIHASPPCQAYSLMSQGHKGKGGLRDERPDLIPPIRARLIESGLPYVVENVEGATREFPWTLRLHGGMFGLRVRRPRLFEISVMVLSPMAAYPTDPLAIYGRLDGGGRKVWTRNDGSTQRMPVDLEEGRAAMDMPWSDWDGIREAIPPAYTEHIGRQLMRYLENR